MVLLVTGILVVLVVMLLGGLFIAIQQEGFQNYLKNKALPYLEEMLSTRVELDRIAVRYPDRLVIKGLVIEDLQQDTLFAMQELEADLDMRRLLRREVVVEYIGVRGLKAKVYKTAGSRYNFEFLTDAFSTDSVVEPEKKDTGAFSIGFQLNTIALKDVDLRFDDDSLLHAHLQWKKLEAKMQEMDLDTRRIGLKLLELTDAGVEVRIPGAPQVVKGFDPGHIRMEGLNFKLNDIVYSPDTLAAELVAMSFREQSGFRLNHLSMAVVLKSQELSIEDFYLRTPHTRIQNSTELAFDSLGQLASELSQVRIKTRFTRTLIGLRDVLFFQPGLRAGNGITLPPVAGVALEFEGTTDRFRASVELESRLAGFKAKAGMQSIDPDNLRGELQVNDLYFRSDSLNVALESVQVKADVENAQKSIQMQLPFAGMVLQGNYRLTQLGNVVHNLMVKYFNRSNSRYLLEDNQNFNLKLRLEDHPFVRQYLPDSVAFSPFNAELDYRSEGKSFAFRATVDSVQKGSLQLKKGEITLHTEGDAILAFAGFKKLEQGQLEVPPLEIAGNLLRKVAGFSVLMRDTLHREENRISGRIDLSGFISPPAPEKPRGVHDEHRARKPELNLDLQIDRLALKSFEAFAADYVDDTEGYLTGNLDIRDLTGKMKMTGALKTHQLALKIRMLDEKFRIPSAEIILDQETIGFNDFDITDENGEKLTLGGKAGFRDFKDVWFDMTVRTQNFRALNSAKAVNDLFFGELYLGLDLTLKGNPEMPVVGGRITVNDHSKLTFIVPQTDPTLTDRTGIVEFVSPGKPLSQAKPVQPDSLTKSSIRGADVGIDISIDKNAVFTMVLDKVTGDYVKLKGEGLLSGAIDPSGKVSLTGKYEFYEGDYELNVSLIRRKFAIRKGSYILWTGEPLSAQMQIVAEYTTHTAPLSLVESRIGSVGPDVRNRYLQRMPFVTGLKVMGELMEPLISFDIVLDETGLQVSKDIVNTTQAQLAQLRTEPPELYKQVFALLLFNQFLAADPLSSSGGGSPGLMVRESAGRIITEQLNQLAGNLVKGIDIEFDIDAIDDYSTGVRQSRTDLNVALSKQFFDDRLKITLGSSFGLEGTPYENQSSSNIAGNFKADYLITRDGRFKLRAYRKNEYQMALLGEIVETGLTFIITMDYNRWNELKAKR